MKQLHTYTEEPAYKILEDDDCKILRSKDMNFNFNKIDGYTETWGKTYYDNPDFSPYGPLICDFEVTTICNGVTGVDGKKKLCEFCYKSNNTKGHNTSFEDFKTVFDKLPNALTQIAFGTDSEAISNPDLIKMMKYSRENGVIPNITLAECSDETANELVNVVGAMAISRYDNKQLCYDTIKKVSDLGLTQVNMHIIVSLENEDNIWETFHDYLAGDIIGLNAIVLLGLKKRGRGINHNILPLYKYKKLIDFALDNNIPIGADSCSGPKLVESVKCRDNFDEIYDMVEPCESACFSIFFDHNCNFFPCSFMPEQDEWSEGIDMLKVKDFMKDVWFAEKTVAFRNKLINNKDCNGCRNCPVFDI